jgi:sugar lactone lactonase YvrE
VSVLRNRLSGPVLAGVLVAALAGPAGSAPAAAGGAGVAGGAAWFPAEIALPDGWRPEGIAIGRLPFAYFGSLADGSIYRADLVTGRGRVISEGPGTPSVGLKIDRIGRLFVAGGSGGDARVVSALTGDVLASYRLAEGDAFVNDVALAGGAAWFTDSFNPVLYRVPIPRVGLATQEDVETVPLSGELVYGEGFNANGISPTPDGRGLLVMQSNTATLYRVDPATGVATEVDLGSDGPLPSGDGILLRGRTLYVVQNQLNQVAVITLNHRGSRGAVVDVLTDPRFDVPTTVAAFGTRLYLPNARFGTEPAPDTPYSAVAIRRH